MDMSTQQSELPVSTSISGRKDKDGTEKVINLMPLKKKLKHLVALKESADAARSQFNAGVKAVAEETGLMSGVVTKLIKARADDKVDDERRKANQLSMIFAEIGGDANPDRQPSFSDSLASGKAVGPKAKDAGDPLAGSDLACNPPPGLDADRLAQADKDAKRTAADKAKFAAKAASKTAPEAAGDASVIKH